MKKTHSNNYISEVVTFHFWPQTSGTYKSDSWKKLVYHYFFCTPQFWFSMLHDFYVNLGKRELFPLFNWYMNQSQKEKEKAKHGSTKEANKAAMTQEGKDRTIITLAVWQIQKRTWNPTFKGTAWEKGEAPEHQQYIHGITVWGDTAEDVLRKGRK